MQTMSAEERIQNSYLTDKRVLLNSPGKKLSELYYTKENSTVEMIENTCTMGRFTQSLSSFSFSGSGAVNFPNSGFLGSVYCQITLPATLANQTLPRGWALMLIDHIDFSLGSSSISNLSINNHTIFQLIMEQCETQEKRSQVLKLAGEEILTAGVVPVGSFMILLPFSNICGLYHKKMLDMTLLNSPITVNVYFKAATSIYGGNTIPPTSITSVQITARQSTISYPDQGLKPILRQNLSLKYSLPFIHKQSYITNFVSGPLGVNGLAPCSFTFDQFINSDLIAICLGVVKRNDVIPAVLGDSINAFNYAPLFNINLLYNGQTVFRADHNLHLLYDCSMGIGSSDFQGSVINPGVVAPFGSVPVNTNVVTFDFSQIRGFCFHAQASSSFANTWRISNQTLNITFDVDSANTQYLVYASYLYNGIFQIDSDGASTVYFD